MKNLLPCALLLAVGCAKSSNIVGNSSFDEWAGSTLAEWTVDRGSIEKVTTWDKNDFGVELVGEDVQISQALSQAAPCFTIEVESSVEESASASIAIQLVVAGQSYGEYTRDLPTASWQLFRYSGNLQNADTGSAPTTLLTIPTRLAFAKTGSGRVILGGLRVYESSCETLPTLTAVSNVPLAEPCSENATCAAGLTCAPLDATLVGVDTRACVQCVSDADCTSGDICGTQSVNGNPARVCVSPLLEVLGEVCSADNECQTSACADSKISLSIGFGAATATKTCVDCNPVAGGLCKDFLWGGGADGAELLGNFCLDAALDPLAQCRSGQVCAGIVGVGLCASARTPCTAATPCPSGDTCLGIGSYSGRCVGGAP